MKTLLANPDLLRIEKIVTRAVEIILVVHTGERSASCPACQQSSTSLHSHYQRCLADLPWKGIAVRVELSTQAKILRDYELAQPRGSLVARILYPSKLMPICLHTRKFFCRNGDCAQRIFCERLPDMAAPYARKTQRLDEVLTLIGFALGGRPGARATTPLAMQTSAHTLLRRVRATALPAAGTARWLMRKAHAMARHKRPRSRIGFNCTRT